MTFSAKDRSPVFGASAGWEGERPDAALHVQAQGQRLRVLRNQRQHLVQQRQTVSKLMFVEAPAGIPQ